MKKRKIIGIILSLIAMLGLGTLGTLSAFAEEEAKAGSLGEIDVYLIAGQSNAVGYGSDGLSASLMNDPRYTDGFENVLYYGVAEGNDYDRFVPVTVGLGKDSGRVGAEVGIADAVADSGRMSAVIKHAIGGSYLYPTTNGTPAQTYGTWTPPSYIEKYGISTENNKIGDIYEAFIGTVTDGIGKLVDEGYTPVIKGIWWMQGEAETPNEAPAKAYRELLSMLITEMRSDLGQIVGKDLSSLPFVMGKITRNPTNETQPPYVYLVNEAQVAVTGEIANTFIVDTSGLKQIDGWHFAADSQHYIGKQFINKVVSASGKYSVTMSGMNASMLGGGAYSEGETVTVTFAPYENCTISEVRMITGSGEPCRIELDGNSTYTFAMPGEHVVFSVDSVDPYAVSTKYGVIPSRFTDAEKYAFILFKDGEMINAFEEWSTFINSNYISGCTLLMRRDYSTSECESAWGLRNIADLSIDLGGFTLTRGNNHLFQALGKSDKSSSTVVRITNGTLKTQFKKDDGNPTSPLIVFNNDSTCTVSDRFEFILNGITVDVTSGRGIVTCYNDGVAGSDSRIVLNDCTILRGSLTTALTLFALSDGDNKNDVEIVINGGRLVSDSLANLTLATFNAPREAGESAPDSLKLGKGSDESEFKIELPSSYSVPETFKFDLTDGGYYPMNPTADSASGKTSYTLLNLGTPYGKIDQAYLSKEDYPFVLFKDGKAIHAFRDWKYFIDKEVTAKADYQSGCTLLLRRNYSTSEASGSCWALTYIRDITIDLGGHTLTRGNNHLFNAISHGAVNTTTSITVISGTLKGNFYKDGTTTPIPSIITFNNDSNSTSTDKYIFDFTDVKFDVTEGRGIIQSTCNSTYKTGKTDSTVTFNNCTFLRGDMTNQMTLFNLNQSANLTDTDVFLNGCKLVIGNAGGLTNLILWDYNPENPAPDSLKIVTDLLVILPSGTAADKTFVTSEGEVYLEKISDNADSTTTYALRGARDLTTEYGTIDAKYASEQDYPFVLFKDGKAIHAFLDWKNFIDKEIPSNAAYQSGCTLLLRRDYSTTEASGNCWALSYLRDITIDLGTHTLTRGDNHLFNAISHGAVNTTTVITLKNGTLSQDLLKSNGTATSPAICFNNDNNSTSTDTYIFNLNGLTLDVSSGRGIVIAYNDGNDNSRVEAVINCNDCTIYRGSKTGTITLYSLTDANNRNDIKVNVCGGYLKTDNTLDGITFASFNEEREAGKGSPDALIFGRGSDGGYMTVTAPEGASDGALSGIFKTDDGAECVFVKASSNSYTLYPSVMVGYKIKTNITLMSNIVYNIYIPTANVQGFTVNGKAVAYTEVTLEGTEYYRVALDLPIAQSLDDIEVCVSLYSGSTAVDAKWTVSVTKYADKVTDGDYTDTAKSLVLDMLVYAVSAYTYFDKEISDDKVSIIDEILSGYEAKLPEGEVKMPESGKYFTDVTVHLGAIPSFRFYLAEGYTASDFAFKIGGSSVSVTEGTDEYGKYLEIATYAYALLDDITYTVTDKATGDDISESYNIYSYYEYALSENDPALIALVEGLMKYSESADAYRASVNALS